MVWTEVCVVTCREFSDLVSLALIEAGSEGSVIRDSADVIEMLNSGIVWDYVDEALLANADPRVFVSGFFPDSADVSSILAVLNDLRARAETDTGAFEISVSKIDSGDWENEWKKYYMPIEYSTFAIVPEWITNHGIDNKKIILLNPGMAFGTGTHETTSMCLSLMEEVEFGGKTVVDLGCGSGILGITAAVLGAKSVLLTDIDEYAIKCASENAQLNNLSKDNVTILQADLLKEQLSLRADVLTANLTAPLLIMAREGINNHLVEGGTLIISGILKDYNEEVLSAYLEGFELVETKSKSDWLAHRLIKRN